MRDMEIVALRMLRAAAELYNDAEILRDAMLLGAFDIEADG